MRTNYCKMLFTFSTFNILTFIKFLNLKMINKKKKKLQITNEICKSKVKKLLNRIKHFWRKN